MSVSLAAFVSCTLIAIGLGVVIGFRGVRARFVSLSNLGRGICERSSGACSESGSDSTEQALAQYKSLTDNMAAAMILHDHSGGVIWCSPYTEVLTGFSLTEIYGIRQVFLQQNIYEEEQSSFRDACALVSSGESYQYRYRFRHKSGILLWFETRAVPVYDEKTSTYKCLSIVIDVTASVHTQLKLEERNRDLNDFTYMVSHDLKAPILTLQGMLGVVEEEIQPDGASSVGVSIAHMKKAISRLESLVGGILELAQVSAYETHNNGVSLAKVIGEVVDDYQLDVERIGGCVRITDDLPLVYGNEKYLYHIFANLLGNSIKYRDSNRALEVSISAEYSASRKRFIVRFSDNGQGIPEEYHKEIFKPFVRISSESKMGSGVGLATVSRLVGKLSGRIYLDVSEQGATFVLELRRPL